MQNGLTPDFHLPWLSIIKNRILILGVHCSVLLLCSTFHLFLNNEHDGDRQEDYSRSSLSFITENALSHISHGEGLLVMTGETGHAQGGKSDPVEMAFLGSGCSASKAVFGEMIK